MADIFVMRPPVAVLCNCGSEIAFTEQPTRDSGRSPLCASCRDAEAAESALISRRALTALVADERGYALHRRVLPRTGTTVDHIFVGAGAVYVISDEVTPTDAEVVVERHGGRFSPLSETLTVDGRTRTDLVDAVRAQCAQVAACLAEHGQADVPVVPVLSFSRAHLSRRGRNRRIAGVRLVGPTTLADEVGADGLFDGDRRFALAMSLVARLPSAV